jgi:hypothetical protein
MAVDIWREDETVNMNLKRWVSVLYYHLPYVSTVLMRHTTDHPNSVDSIGLVAAGELAFAEYGSPPRLVPPNRRQNKTPKINTKAILALSK